MSKNGNGEGTLDMEQEAMSHKEPEEMEQETDKTLTDRQDGISTGGLLTGGSGFKHPGHVQGMSRTCPGNVLEMSRTCFPAIS